MKRRYTLSSGGMAIILAVAVVFSGCERRLYQTYGFEAAEFVSAGGGRVGIQIEGGSQLLDSAGTRIDRTSGPYWIGIYIALDRRQSLDSAYISLEGVDSGRRFVPVLSAARTLSDSITWFTEATGIPLSHENQNIELRLKFSAGDSVQVDSLQTVMITTFHERAVSFGEWFSRL